MTDAPLDTSYFWRAAVILPVRLWLVPEMTDELTKHWASGQHIPQDSIGGPWKCWCGGYVWNGMQLHLNELNA